MRRLIANADFVTGFGSGYASFLTDDVAALSGYAHSDEVGR
jgi:hypothetical protein